jgi:hypothetical protein
MKLISALLGGLAGAVALNLLHETIKKIDKNAPRVDLVGEEALSKTMEAAGIDPPKGDQLYTATLVSDLISNTIYYGTIGLGADKNIISRGLGMGLLAGIGAVKLPKPMGLDEAPVARTDKTKLLTVVWYTTGALVTAVVTKALRKSK